MEKHACTYIHAGAHTHDEQAHKCKHTFKHTFKHMHQNVCAPMNTQGKLGGTDYYRDLLSLETVTTLNAAFCDFHLRHCPPSQQLLDVCTMVRPSPIRRA